MMIRKKKKILLYLIVVVYFLLILITLTGCGSTNSTITFSDKNQKKEEIQRYAQKELVRDSVVYREKIKNDTVYIEVFKEKTKIMHDTSYIYFAVSDTVYTVKHDEITKEKLIKETPWYNYCIIILLAVVILYLLIGKLFKS